MSLLISSSPILSMGTSRKRRALTVIATLLTAALVTGFGYAPLMRGFASFLIVEDALQPAAAIVALAGQTPFRELEAAKLYHAGWAPTVVIVREAPSAELDELERLGIKRPEEWELSRAVLIQQGVPPAAIAMPEGEGLGTLEELQAVYTAVRSEALGVSGAPGKEHGAGSMETEVGSQRSEVRDQSSRHQTQATQLTRNAGTQHGATVIGHPSSVAANNATNAKDTNKEMPVIIVTSKYHTRRTRLTWQYVTGGRSQPIARAASLDPFDPDRWWQQRSFVLSVVREYLGLANYYAGFPVTP